jgi:hypothetical protein
MRPKRDLVRVVRTPTREIRVDPTGKAAGRGAYVCPAEACAEVAVREGRLSHALEVPVEAALLDELRAAIRRSAGASVRN